MSSVQPRPLLCGLAPFVLGLLLVIAGCSSPTTPTPPVTNPPPPTNPPVNPPPSLSVSCPAAVVITTSTAAAVPIPFAPPLAAGGVVPVQLSCTPPSGSPFPVGSTVVRCTATDAAAQEAGCTFGVTVTLVPRLTRTKFLAFGDSFTAGEVTAPLGTTTTADGVPNFSLAVIPSVSYPTQLLSLLQARYTAQTATIDVINAGMPGETAENGAKRLPGVFSATRPEVLLLFQGANELSTGQAGIQRAWVALDTMAKEGRLRGARVFMATLAPSRAGSRAIPTQLVVALNDRIRSTAIGEGAVLVDLYNALLPGVAQYIGVDGLHPTEAGYRKMAETFFDAIRSELEVR